jgi:hypothetical protein
MCEVLVCLGGRHAPAFRARVLRSWSGRLRGLLGTTRADPSVGPVLLVRCGSVHTFGMRYELDLALLDGEGRVLVARRGTGAGRVVSARGACLALERPSGLGPWPEVGEYVRFEKAEATGAARMPGMGA